MVTIPKLVHIDHHFWKPHISSIQTCIYRLFSIATFDYQNTTLTVPKKVNILLVNIDIVIPMSISSYLYLTGYDNDVLIDIVIAISISSYLYLTGYGSLSISIDIINIQL